MWKFLYVHANPVVEVIRNLLVKERENSSLFCDEQWYDDIVLVPTVKIPVVCVQVRFPRAGATPMPDIPSTPPPDIPATPEPVPPATPLPDIPATPNDVYGF